MHNDMRLMGNVIRNARENKSITQQALAAKIEVSHRTIIAIENGKRNPTFEVLYLIINALDIPADLIFRPNDLPNTPEQEQFMREFLNATNQEQYITMASSRSVWVKMREDNVESSS